MKILRPHQSETVNAVKHINEGIIHLPTGTGKTFIQASIIAENLQNNRVFVILSPRILLTNQLYNEVSSILKEQNKDCQYLIVHSGKNKEDKDAQKWTNDLPFREVNSTTSSTIIKEDYERAVRENVPLIIFGTYDSAERIVQSKIPVYMLFCDEAHNLVNEEFNWIRYENYTDNRLQFNAERKYYFTATLKTTASDAGLGMNNSEQFGQIIYSKSPLEMVNAGEILRPRMHFVDCADYNAENEIDADVNAIVESFIQHKALCYSAKMLVVTKGTEHLNDIVNHPSIKRLQRTRPNLRIFDISSEYKPRINGSEVKRDVFLSELQTMKDTDDALIFHVRILTEGIDVPGITGVMIMNNLELGPFLQTLGRATRLYKTDRENLYNGTIKPNDLEEFVKPYAWIIIPVYGVIGDDLRKNIQEMVYGLRTFGFNATQDCVIKQSRGKALPVSFDMLNELDTNALRYKDMVLNIVHEVESKEMADKLEIADFQFEQEIKAKHIDEVIELFATI